MNGGARMDMDNNTEIQSQSAEVAVTAAGALVGFAVGGPVGAIVGSVTTPVVKLAKSIVQCCVDRRKARISSSLNAAFSQTGYTDEEILTLLANNPNLADDVLKLLRQLVDTDPELDFLFTSIIASMITEQNSKERRRLLALSESIKGLNSIQVQIIRLIADHDYSLSASEIAIGLDVPEIELRNAVRDMELRGIITDNNSDPTVWELRELGIAINKVVKDMEVQYG